MRGWMIVSGVWLANRRSISRRLSAAACAVSCVALIGGCSTAPSSHATTTGAASGTSSAARGKTGAASRPGGGPGTGSRASSGSATTQRRWQHVVVVVEENHGAAQILGQPTAPFLNALARSGLTFTDMHGETHPSQPNYLALLSGSTQGLTDDSCPHRYAADNLVSELLRSGFTFTGYSESLPSAGYTGCNDYPYARRHVPWTDFASAPAAVNQPLTAMPADFARLPTVSFVIPNLLNDMHDGSVARGDAWLQRHLGAYASWARTHRSLLLVTWDEDEGSDANRIATIAVGDGIEPATWSPRADHYTLLAALERSFGLPPLGQSAHATALPPIS